MGVDDGGDDRQTEPNPLVALLAGRVDAVEAIEQAGNVLGRNVRAGILDRDLDVAGWPGGTAL